MLGTIVRSDCRAMVRHWFWAWMRLYGRAGMRSVLWVMPVTMIARVIMMWRWWPTGSKTDNGRQKHYRGQKTEEP